MNPTETAQESILMVDDNPTNLQILFQTLKEMGCKLQVAKDGPTALSIAQKSLPSLILLDIMMPEVDGYEVCRSLKEDIATQDIPVIFLSALGETQDKVKGLKVGAVDYITKPFQAEEVIARVDTHLTISRLRREVALQKEQLEQELQTVQDLQRKLLPGDLPQISGLALAAHYETSRYAGGDYYDFVEMPDNRWGILIADAEGHSAPAAVNMAMACALFRSYPGVPSDPGKVLDYMNQHLCKVISPSFITAYYLVYDAETRRVRTASAGHPAPLICRSSEEKASIIPGKGVYALGIYPYKEIPVNETTLDSGDRLIFYTDGLTERFSPEDELYGESRLLQQLENSDADTPGELLEQIIDSIERFAAGRSPDDDQALIVAVVE